MLSSVDGRTQTVQIPAGETRLITYTGLIKETTNYTFNFTADLNQTITQTVAFGLAADLTLAASLYPEGRIAIPVTMKNTGQFDEPLTVYYILGQQSAVVERQSKTYFLPKGASITDTLSFDLVPDSISFLPKASFRLPLHQPHS